LEAQLRVGLPLINGGKGTEPSLTELVVLLRALLQVVVAFLAVVEMPEEPEPQPLGRIIQGVK
jgi:hypothetical protein